MKRSRPDDKKQYEQLLGRWFDAREGKLGPGWKEGRFHPQWCDCIGLTSLFTMATPIRHPRFQTIWRCLVQFDGKRIEAFYGPINGHVTWRVEPGKVNAVDLFDFVRGLQHRFGQLVAKG